MTTINQPEPIAKILDEMQPTIQPAGNNTPEPQPEPIKKRYFRPQPKTKTFDNLKSPRGCSTHS